MRLGAYLRLGRVSNLPTVWTNVLTGVATASVALEPAALAVLLPGISLLYVAGMYLNDAFDAKVDRIERPERPIPSGAVSAGRVFGLGFGMLGAGLALIGAGAMARGGSDGGAGLTIASAGMLCGAIVTYDAWHKNNPLGPVLMALCRALVYATAALFVAGALPFATWVASAALLAYLAGLTLVAKRKKRSPGALALLLAPALGGSILALVEGHAIALVLFVLIGVWTLRALGILRLGPAPRTVPDLLAGICVLDAALLAHAGRTDLAAAAVALGVLTLVLQRRVPAD